MGPAKGVPAAACGVGAPGRAELLAQPTRLHPGLWRAQGGGASGVHAGALPSGFAALDVELPGGGWPVRVLTELLLPEPGVGEIRLLAPMLAPLARSGRAVMLFDPPAEVNAVALAELGWPPGQCVIVRLRPAPQQKPAGAGGRKARRAVPGAELCWAVEQALRSGQVGAVLAWPGAAARPEALRRMQLAAQSHEGPAFLLRELAAHAQPSPAPLRLVLQPAGADDLQLQIVKRKGPAMAQSLRLTLAPVLSQRALARSRVLPQREAAALVATGETAMAAQPGRAGLPMAPARRPGADPHDPATGMAMVQPPGFRPPRPPASAPVV
ncbi:translesion DNA synthesis-associated protein ImuA [Ideonella sp.]|uniref:translesion DNA synthesis-associated protein ImuA n=1 Tax=Ideonella sp. TaxID=1929293 RepID=UPI0035ADED04